jgi:hypothetical protein
MASAKRMDLTSPIALLLRGGTASSNDRSLVEILNFFGIPWTALAPGQANADAVSNTAGHSRFSILASASTLAEALQEGAFPALRYGFLTHASSVFVYGFQPTDSDRNLLRTITGDSSAEIRNLTGQPVSASVTADFPHLCGSMSGIQVPLQPGAAHSALTIHRPASDEFQSIIAAPEGQLFAAIRHAGVPFFLDASQSILDIHQRAASYFDVTKFFAGAVPLVMYLKWSFRDVCPRPPQTNACLIIDDPLLQQRYGFLDFRELAQLMEKQTFATTIAFIPWNWRRTSRKTVSTFQKNSEKLSICVHGCDHTSGEFATRSAVLLDRMLKTAKHRMNSLLDRTGLHHDRVMVFPQGAFSPAAGMALKRNGFIAAVNTEVAPKDGSNETTIEDLWSVAILRYGEFPIFTRRYISHGLQNFAFDGLLGKPCFVVGHHDLLRDHGRNLSEFVARLNALNWTLSWRTIGNAVCRSYSVQRRNGTVLLKMFSEHLILENSEAPQQLTVLKEESDVDAIRSVTVNGEIVDYSYSNGCLQFIVNVPSGTTAEIRCNYREEAAHSTSSEPISKRARVAARRHLSAFRDNYLSTNDFVLRAVSVARRMRQLLKKGDFVELKASEQKVSK